MHDVIQHVTVVCKHKLQAMLVPQINQLPRVQEEGWLIYTLFLNEACCTSTTPTHGTCSSVTSCAKGPTGDDIILCCIIFIPTACGVVFVLLLGSYQQHWIIIYRNRFVNRLIWPAWSLNSRNEKHYIITRYSYQWFSMKYIESCVSSLPIQMGAEQVEEISTPDTSYNLAGHSSRVGKSRASFEVICRSLHAPWFSKWGCEDRGAKVWPRNTPTESYVPSGIHCLCIYITA